MGFNSAFKGLIFSGQTNTQSGFAFRTYSELTSSNIYVGLSKWQLAHNELSSFTAVKQRKLRLPVASNQAVQTTVIDGKIVGSALCNRPFCC